MVDAYNPFAIIGLTLIETVEYIVCETHTEDLPRAIPGSFTVAHIWGSYFIVNSCLLGF